LATAAATRTGGRAPGETPLPIFTRLEAALGETVPLIAFLVPALAILAIAQAYPLFSSLALSFRDWTLSRSPEPGGFIGFANYTRALNDHVFLGSAGFTIVFAVSSTLLQMAFGLAIAILVVGESFALRLVRTLLMLPMVFIDAWQWTPFVTIIYTAALASLPGEVLEAAAVDGASRRQTFRLVVWPMLLPVTVLIAMFRLIDSLLTLDVVFTTTFGGPGFATHTLSFWIYEQGLRYFNISYAAATSWLLLILCMATAAVFLLWRRRVTAWQGRHAS